MRRVPDEKLERAVAMLRRQHYDIVADTIEEDYLE